MPCFVRNQNGFTVIACTRGRGRKATKCSYCNNPGNLLCDYPIGDGRTCDKPICPKCSVRVASNTDYCLVHGAREGVK